MTTVGYGDVIPTTAEGRMAAAVLMVQLGIGLYARSARASLMTAIGDVDMARQLGAAVGAARGRRLTDVEYVGCQGGPCWRAVDGERQRRDDGPSTTTGPAKSRREPARGRLVGSGPSPSAASTVAGGSAWVVLVTFSLLGAFSVVLLVAAASARNVDTAGGIGERYAGDAAEDARVAGRVGPPPPTVAARRRGPRGDARPTRSS